MAVAVGGGEVFGEGCSEFWVYWMVLCDIIDGDLDASISSTSSTDKSKTASNPCKILVCRIVDVGKCLLTIFHFCSAVKYSANYCSLQIQTGFSRFKQASAAPFKLKYIIIQHSKSRLLNCWRWPCNAVLWLTNVFSIDYAHAQYAERSLA